MLNDRAAILREVHRRQMRFLTACGKKLFCDLVDMVWVHSVRWQRNEEFTGAAWWDDHYSGELTTALVVVDVLYWFEREPYHVLWCLYYPLQVVGVFSGAVFIRDILSTCHLLHSTSLPQQTHTHTKKKIIIFFYSPINSNEAFVTVPINNIHKINKIVEYYCLIMICICCWI